MSEGAKLNSLVDSLEKVTRNPDFVKCSNEDLNTIKLFLMKINKSLHYHNDHQMSIGHYAFNQLFINRILHMLETSRDKAIVLNSIEIILALLESSSQVRKKFYAFYPSCTQILLKLINNEYKGHEPTEEIFITLHKILAIIGPKDPKFALKARGLQTAKVTSTLFKRHQGSPEDMIPLLRVLKMCCVEATTATQISKTPIVTTLLEILNNYLRRHDKVVKLILLVYILLFRTKCCVDTFIGKGGIDNFLDIIECWTRDDTKNRTLKIRSSLLLVLGHVVCFKSGMTALQKMNGVQRLYRTCLSLKQSKKLDSYALLMCNIMRNCLTINKLPVTSSNSPLRVERPISPKQETTSTRSLLPVVRDLDKISIGEDIPLLDDSVESDDFGLDIDHYTRGFFDPRSILNTNIGHPKRALLEPNELKLKNLFNLVSIQDETNQPFSKIPSITDLQKKGSKGQRSNSRVRDGTSQTGNRATDEDCYFHLSKDSDLLPSFKTSTKGTCEGRICESVENDTLEEQEIERNDREEKIESIMDNFLSYESFFEELNIADKLLSKHGHCPEGQSLPHFGLPTSFTKATEGMAMDCSLNCNIASNNDYTNYNDYTGDTGDNNSSRGSNSSCSQPRDSERFQEPRGTRSEACDINRNDRRTSDINCSSSNRPSSSNYFRLPPAGKPTKANSTSLENLEKLQNVHRSCNQGSTGILEILQRMVDEDQFQVERKTSDTSQQSSSVQSASNFQSDKQRRAASKNKRIFGKSPLDGNLTRKSQQGRTSDQQFNKTKPKSKLSPIALSLRGKSTPRMSHSDSFFDEERDKTNSENEELQRKLSERLSGGGCPALNYSAPSMPPSYRGSGSGSAATFKGLSSSTPFTYHRLNKDTERYLELTSQTVSMVPFNKVAYPDLYGHALSPEDERSIPNRRIELLRNRLLEDIRREIDPNDLINATVYNVDDAIFCQSHLRPFEGIQLRNDDEKFIFNSLNDLKSGKKRCPHLNFDSLFESGNLRKAIKVREFEYDLILMPDLNTRGQHQWFYFRVTDMRPDTPYRFNIINCEKANSQFNFGMQPLLFSVVEAILGRPFWLRSGEHVCYYRNHLLKSPHLASDTRLSNLSFYYTASFTITFQHSPDVCYLAYHYPYTYTTLMHYLDQLENTNNSQRSCHGNASNDFEAPAPTSHTSTANDDLDLTKSDLDNEVDSYNNNNAGFVPRSNKNPSTNSVIYLRNQLLCKTLGGNNVQLVTITALPVLTGHLQTDLNTTLTIRSRPYVFLTARVHPGETNSSWVMRGTLDYLLSECDNAKQLRESFIFKVIPMLNPDGVINGNHRCSLFGEDLNRHWLEPSLSAHSSIFHVKALMLFLQSKGLAGIYTFCDYHGHSRKKNVFLYGCSPLKSWMNDDVQNPTVRVDGAEDVSYKVIPAILEKLSPGFHLRSCSFGVEKSKETTARVVVWRQVGVVRSYTMESTYCGFDQGQYKGLQINTYHHEEMGRTFLLALGMSRAPIEDVNALVNNSDLDDQVKPPKGKRQTRGSSESSESMELEEMMEEVNEGVRDQESEERPFSPRSM